MTTSFEDIWAKLLVNLRTAGIVKTLGNGVVNEVVSATQEGILLRSRSSRSGKKRAIPRARFKRFWDQLVVEGSSPFRTGDNGSVVGAIFVRALPEVVNQTGPNEITLVHRSSSDPAGSEPGMPSSTTSNHPAEPEMRSLWTRSGDDHRANDDLPKQPQAAYAEVDRLYDLLASRRELIRSRYGRTPTVGDLPGSRDQWRTKGVYFIFEESEKRAESHSETKRVTRVGSHSGRNSTIESRIVGEHAADWGRSVFRRLVGTALIRRGDFDHSIVPSDRDKWAETWYSRQGQWAVQHDPKRLDPMLHALHPMVTSTISAMDVLWVEIDDRTERLELEKQCIMLLSNDQRAAASVDPASAGWLGHFALSEKVRASGLWNQQHVTKPHTEGFLSAFARYFRT